MARTILVTGGAGFIGSHMVVALQRAGHHPIIIDNFANAMDDVVDNIANITGKKPIVIKGDVRDDTLLHTIFRNHKISAIAHFAGLKAVAESVKKPLEYFSVNVGGSIVLLRVAAFHNIKNFIFSSTATVYGQVATLPVTEQTTTAPINPYGESKLMVENILQTTARSDHHWRIAILRYFNPCGADDSGLIGENPRDIPNNLMPIMLRVAGGEMPMLNIYGNDYDTKDGTGIRDYIHVVDLAAAHLHALDYLESHGGVSLFNLGRGHGYSVLDMVMAFQKTIGHNRPLPYQFAPRRAGDVPALWTDARLAEQKLGWRATHDIGQMCDSAWRFYQQYKKNPLG